MSRYRIRTLDEGSDPEIDTVTRWCMETVLETIPEFQGQQALAQRALRNFDFGQMRAMITADFPRPTHRSLVAVDGSGQLVGQSLFSFKVDEQGLRYGHFFSRYVHPEHRRRGLGGRLLDQAETWLVAQDCAYLLGHTHADNLPLQGLFSSRGFRVVERRHNHWPTLILKKELPAAHAG